MPVKTSDLPEMHPEPVAWGRMSRDGKHLCCVTFSESSRDFLGHDVPIYIPKEYIKEKPDAAE